MAYGHNQQKIMAWEVARAGRIIDKATKALRGEYESFRRLSSTTLTRYMMLPAFQALVAEAEQKQGKMMDMELLERDKKRYQEEHTRRAEIQDINELKAARERLEDECRKLMERRHELQRAVEGKA